MIRLEHVRRAFLVGDQVVNALDDLSLAVASGEYVSIMGPSGSGKSTLLNILGLLDRPTSGTYRLAGKDVTELTENQQAQTRREKVGFVFQFFHLVPRMTAEQNIALPLVLAGVPPAERRARTAEILAAVSLSDRGHHRPDQLSGGQRQRVAIARAMIMGPALLLADEPTGNLDSSSGMDVIRLLERLNATGITLAIVTHDAEIGGRAGRTIRLVDGRIVSDSRGEGRSP
jgi:putative ABC transport system ATP-binding protein